MELPKKWLLYFFFPIGNPEIPLYLSSWSSSFYPKLQYERENIRKSSTTVFPLLVSRSLGETKAVNEFGLTKLRRAEEFSRDFAEYRDLSPRAHLKPKPGRDDLMLRLQDIQTRWLNPKEYYLSVSCHSILQQMNNSLTLRHLWLLMPCLPTYSNISQDGSLGKKFNESALSFWKWDYLIFSGNKERHQLSPSSHFSSFCFTHLPNIESTDVSACGVSLPNQFRLLIGAGGIISSMCSLSLNPMSLGISHTPRFKIWYPSLKTTVFPRSHQPETFKI